jgi:hypothetical protein
MQMNNGDPVEGKSAVIANLSMSKEVGGTPPTF